MVGFVAHSAAARRALARRAARRRALVALSRLDPPQFLEEVEWATLVFFAGLFIMVGALVEVGVIDRLGSAVTDAVGDRYLLASSALLWGSAALSGDRGQHPVRRHDGSAGPGPGPGRRRRAPARALWWALALGADLGGNATAVGASANVVIIGIAAKNGHPISFWRFTRYGLVVAAVTVAISWVYLWLRYYAW